MGRSFRWKCQPMSDKNLSANPDSLRQTWEEHLRHEFETKDTEQTLATMVEDAHVNHVPVMTGVVGREGLREFYSKRFIARGWHRRYSAYSCDSAPSPMRHL
jgi:hypothetical protein